MACRVWGTKSLIGLIPTYCQVEPKEHIVVQENAPENVLVTHRVTRNKNLKPFRIKIGSKLQQTYQEMNLSLTGFSNKFDHSDNFECIYISMMIKFLQLY